MAEDRLCKLEFHISGTCEGCPWAAESNAGRVLSIRLCMHPDILDNFVVAMLKDDQVVFSEIPDHCPLPKAKQYTKGEKPILAIDFDGVIHQGKSKFVSTEVIPDDPVDGAFEFILEAMEFYEVHIHSTRNRSQGGIRAMTEWFELHDFPCTNKIVFPSEKTPAKVYLDDRAFRFGGVFPLLPTLLDFKPWHKRH